MATTRASDFAALQTMDCRVMRKHKLLVVDDDQAIRISLKFSLELEGFMVKAFDSAERVLERPLLNNPSCFILDHRLPGIDGLSLLRALRDRGELCPAVLITSNPTRAVRKRAQEAQAVLIEKPLLGDDLTTAIITLIKSDPRRGALG